MAKLGPFHAHSTTSVSPAAGGNAQSNLAGNGETLRVFNPTNGICFVKVGSDNTVSAAATDHPIPAGGDRLIDIGMGTLTLFVSVFLAAAATPAAIYLQRGDGSTMT